MLRVVIRTSDHGAAANIGGDVDIRVKTFDIEHPAIEALMMRQDERYLVVQVVGIELIPEVSPAGAA